MSTFTYFLNMGGNLARLFTTIKETQDWIMAAGFVVSFVLNLIVFLQIIYYNKPKKKESDDDFFLKEKVPSDKDDKKDKNDKNGKKKKNKKVE